MTCVIWSLVDLTLIAIIVVHNFQALEPSIKQLSLGVLTPKMMVLSVLPEETPCRKQGKLGFIVV